MPNPYLPEWEYIPDGEPRVFGDRVYIYGSHDRPNSEEFCDHRLKCWSAPVDDPGNWTCHGDIFHTQPDRDHAASTDWTDASLFAPDVVYKDGKYYLFAYIVGSKGCVAVCDRPEGPFEVVGCFDSSEQYELLKKNPADYVEDPDSPDRYLVDGKPEEPGTRAEMAIRDMEFPIMIDPGVLVDDDGRVYVYCGYLHSYMFELDPNDMHTVIPGSYKFDIIPQTEPFNFFEACSPRKIGDTYYLIYSPRRTTTLAYATSKSPTGPFEFKGTLIDSGDRYPGGNDHGSVACIRGQWYVFYHKMTNGTIMSRQGCADRIELLPDGTFKQAEMTSCGFEESLNPYREIKADWACVLDGGCYIAERDFFTREIINISGGCTIGYKYLDFGDEITGTHLNLFLKCRGCSQRGIVKVHWDSPDNPPAASGEIRPEGGPLKIHLPAISGRHAIFFTFETGRTSWMKQNFDGRELTRIESFVFTR